MDNSGCLGFGKPSFHLKWLNRMLKEGHHKAIVKDFPKPSCRMPMTPKLDVEMKRQIKKAGKDPHFGQSGLCISCKSSC